MTTVNPLAQFTPSPHIRAVNLRTDLAPLADLIELVFASTMDDSGRAAIREMRTLSRLGWALTGVGRLNDLILGISLGHVWIEEGHLVGNVSIYPSRYPRELGSAWVIANVGVHPQYQRRGIARQLMLAALQTIAARGGAHAILQVDYDNDPAIALYEQLGFRQERAFSQWIRSSLSPIPRSSDDPPVFITQRRAAEWQVEYELAQQTRPNARGGMGWQKPLHAHLFHKSLVGQLWDTVTLNAPERLIVRSADERRLIAVAWVENALTATRARLTLFNDPEAPAYVVEALLSTLLRRYRNTPFQIEHPYDDDMVNLLLQKYHFRAERAVWHMRFSF